MSRSHDGGPFPLAHHYTQRRETPEERERRRARTARAAAAWKVGVRRPVTAPLSMLPTVTPPGDDGDMEETSR